MDDGRAISSSGRSASGSLRPSCLDRQRLGARRAEGLGILGRAPSFRMDADIEAAISCRNISQLLEETREAFPTRVR